MHLLAKRWDKTKYIEVIDNNNTHLAASDAASNAGGFFTESQDVFEI